MELRGVLNKRQEENNRQRQRQDATIQWKAPGGAGAGKRHVADEGSQRRASKGKYHGNVRAGALDGTVANYRRRTDRSSYRDSMNGWNIRR